MQEWYLLTPNTSPNIIGGYENESFIDYKDDAFCEVLQTDIAVNVTLYNSDFSNSSKIRCVIQGNMADTQLKSMERVGLFSRNTVKAGMYVYFEDRYWLITGYPGTNGVYEKATMVLCQYKLRWQNSSGDIIERWCNGTSASKYDMGENGNSTITLSSNTFALLLPDDLQTLELDGRRVFIDKHKTNPTKVYKVTRSDDILYDYGNTHGGILSFIADKREFNPITDNQELRICDYHPPAPSPEPPESDETTDLSVVIIGGSTLRCGREKSWSVSFRDSNGNEIEHDFEWIVDSDFNVHQESNGNIIKLKVDDEQFIDCSFLLSIAISNAVVAKAEITIIDGL